MALAHIDPLTELARTGVVVCYAPRLDHDAIWLPEDGLLVLNAECTRARLSLAVADLLPEIAERFPPLD